MKKRQKIFIFLFSLFSLAVGSRENGVFLLAQSSTSEWSDPVNVSHSGATRSAQFVKASDETVHLIWQDEVANQFVYTQRNGDVWREPVLIEVPFGTRVYYPDLEEEDPTPLFTPRLVSDGDGRIHAFWLDADNALYHSQVEAANFADFASWTAPELVASQAAAFAPAVAGGVVHIIYVNPSAAEEAPAGVYYRQNSGEVQVTETEEGTVPANTPWTAPIALHESPYFRLNSDASLAIASAQINGATYLYAVWDNRSLDKVYFARSPNGGQSWEERIEIDGREEADDPEGVGPSHIQISAQGEEVLLVWQASHGSLFCTLFYTWSEDAGESWKLRESLLADNQACPEQRLLVDTESTLRLLSARFGEVTSFLAWENGMWSEPAVQPDLAGFIDGETNRRLNYSWQDMMVVGGNTLVVIGRDGEQNNDVWQLSRSLGEIVDWFPPPSRWSPMQIVAESETNVADLTITADNQGQVHLAWRQLTSLEGAGSTIFYSRWDGEGWSRPAGVLASPLGEQALQPAIASNRDGRVFMVWGNERGELFISQAPNSRANIAADWSDPQPIPVLQETANSPHIIFGPDERLYVSYALTLNEERGVYLVYSEDNGLTWSDPVLVFDAVAAEWEMVNGPKMLMPDLDKMHMIWVRHSLPPAADAFGLYYASSENRGEAWAEPEVVVEGAVQWYALEGIAGLAVHRLWRETGENESVYWHQLSMDGGISWQPAERISGLESLAGPSDLTIDSEGRLHLLTGMDRLLIHYIWEDGQWSETELLNLSAETQSDNQFIRASVSSNGVLVGAYSGQTYEPATDTTFGAIFMTGQQLQLSNEAPMILPTLTPTPQPSATATAVPSPSPTPRVQFDPGQVEQEPPFGLPILDNNLVLLALSIVPVILIILLIVMGRAFWLGRR